MLSSAQGKPVYSVLGKDRDRAPAPPDVLEADKQLGGVVTTSSELLSARTALLTALADGAVRPAIILSGGSGSGKSYLCKLLKELGCEQADRLISRPKRGCDPDSDIPWNSSSGDCAQEILLSYAKNNALYGVPTSTVKQLLVDQMSPIFIVGDMGKISPYNRAVDVALPLVPRINIRLDVPVDVMADRLNHQRQESFEGEAQERGLQNKRLFSWEASQHRVLKQVFNLHVVLNLTEEEHSRLGYAQSQLKPLSVSLLRELLPSFSFEAIKRSKSLARDVLLARDLSDIPELPQGLAEVFRDTLVPSFSAHNIDLFAVKGGLAVAAYLSTAQATLPELALNGEKPIVLLESITPSSPIVRPVSPDIDWAIGTFANEEQDHLNMVRAITGSDVSFQNQWNKPIFNSYKLHAVVATQDGAEVELDAIALSRVKPEGSPFCFEFPYDEYLAFRSRPLSIAGKESAALVPPEMLIVEKLVAGRGAQHGKLDLFDAVALIATQPIDVHVIDHIIDSQRFIDRVDSCSDFTPSEDAVSSAYSLRETLQQNHIQHPELVVALVSRCLTIDPTTEAEATLNGQSLESEVSLDFEKTRDNLKRIALIDCLLQNLDACISTIASEAPNELSELVAVCGQGVLVQKLSAVRDYLMYLATYQIGRPDVYIRHEPLSSLRVTGWKAPLQIREDIAHDHM